ncbi:hypothetical protein [Nocardia sp. NPDC057455]|uniref:hypothetical protein n=1 Tax=Nocardia sp. NPDC057455 TaxID=3346138 RepID=UPI003671D6E5
MYFAPDEVRRLCATIFDRLPGVELMFDIIPPWFSRKTMTGFPKTPHYTAPPMPWGVKRSDAARRLREWSPRVAEVTRSSFSPSRGPLAVSLPLFERLPVLRDTPPAIVHARGAV